MSDFNSYYDGIVLAARNVRKSFGPLEIIHDVNIDIKHGERHALIGPNGAGKSTMFNLLSAAFPPTSGEILLDGAVINSLEPFEVNRRGLSRSFQITSIFPRLTIFENLRIGAFARFGVRFNVWSTAGRLRKVNDEADRLLRLVRLERVASELAGNLAYSDRRALELGLTLATDPRVILLDEPTAGMSREEAEYTTSLIKTVTEGRTLLIVEHDLDVVFSLADRISVLVHGQIIASESPAEIKCNAAVHEAYLGKETATC
ncbi:ABC transporter ATP-binding protein [Bradyrhizobium sp. RDT10]